MAANYHSVGNLKVMIDRNRIQNDDFLEVQMEVGDIAAKLLSFDWSVREIDGHSMSEIVDALEWAAGIDDGPCAIVAHTVKGRAYHSWRITPLSMARRQRMMNL